MVKRLVIFVLLSVLAIPAATILSLCPMLTGETAPVAEHECCQRHAGKAPDCHPQPCATRCALNHAPDALAPPLDLSKVLPAAGLVSSRTLAPITVDAWVSTPNYLADSSSLHLRIGLLRI